MTGNCMRRAKCVVKKREYQRRRVAMVEGESEKDAKGGGKEKGERKHREGKKKRKRKAPGVEHLTKGVGGPAFLFFSFNRILHSPHNRDTLEVMTFL